MPSILMTDSNRAKDKTKFTTLAVHHALGMHIPWPCATHETPGRTPQKINYIHVKAPVQWPWPWCEKMGDTYPHTTHEHAPRTDIPGTALLE